MRVLIIRPGDIRLVVDLDDRAPMPLEGQYLEATSPDDETPVVGTVARVDWQVEYGETATPALTPRIWIV